MMKNTLNILKKYMITGKREDKMKREKFDPELIIDREMKGIKFKRTKIPMKFESNIPDQLYEYRYADGYSMMDWGYHKEVYSKTYEYVITHIPSGMKAYAVNTTKQARELVYRLAIMPIYWNGEGEMPDDFGDAAKDRIEAFRNREPIINVKEVLFHARKKAL